MNKLLKIHKIFLYLYRYMRLLMYKSKQTKYDGKIIVYDTSLNSDNLGDEIINYYCNNIFKELGVQVERRLPTHTKPKMIDDVSATVPKVITGTNILSSKMESPILWDRVFENNIVDNIVLMGNGWESYSQRETIYTRKFYSKMLSKKFIHSVRDGYSQKKLKRMGVENVINTACPTTWNLTEEFCKQIPTKKGKKVITTITDYSKDMENDWYMLDILLSLYDEVYIWIQGEKDYEYLEKYHNLNKLRIVDRNLESYNQILGQENLDYVGTRLHAGIHALNYKHRTLIVSIDNRAREMGNDINLPIIERKNLKKELRDRLINPIKADITIPIKNIELWKKQFKEASKDV